MPRLTLNGRELAFETGATILDVARAHGVEIPTLCWYPRLSTVANCRICLVSVQGAAKLVPACGSPATDGMVVNSESDQAAANRRDVLRLLLERYPAEHLGNGGRDHPRNEFERYVVRYGGPVGKAGELGLRHGDTRPGDVMIQHDMSLCILCTRCVRACDEIQEVGVLDVGRRGEHTEIIVGGDGDPDHAGCTWCGECVRVCPTGAIFEVIPRARFGEAAVQSPDKVVRSVCPYCGVGCQIDLHTRGDQLVRVTSPWIEERTPNMGSTCVKGRFGYDFAQHRDRLTRPLVREGGRLVETDWETAMSQPQPLLHSRQADWTHRSTSSSASPSSRRRSTRAGHTVPCACGVRSPQMSAIRSGTGAPVREPAETLAIMQTLRSA